MNLRFVLYPGLALLLPLALLSPAVFAQDVPRPKEFYFDEDPAVARPIQIVPGDDEAAIERLMQIIERKQRDADRAGAQLAHIAMASGRTDTGRALYLRALDGAGARSMLRHTLHWNYGWDLLHAGDAEGALQQWLAAFSGRLNNPDWVPSTLALALWRLDRRNEAVAWYAAAVRTHPDRWIRPDFAALLPDWRDDERATLAEVHASWLQDPPTWP